MITQTINLNLIPGAVPPRVNVTQYDEGSRTIVANLYNGTSTFTPSAGTTAKVKGTKPDKHGFEYDATISGRTVEIDLTQQMSCVAGDVLCEVELTLNDEVLGTGTFVLRVKASALADDTDISETEIPDIIDAARSSAASAAASAETAQEAANSVSVEYTASGNPISVSAFPTEASVSMTIAPTQNLHGYDKPWAGGAGKNKLENTASTSTINGVTFTVNSDGTVTCNTDENGATENTVFVLHTWFDIEPGAYLVSGCSGGQVGSTVKYQIGVNKKIDGGSESAAARNRDGDTSLDLSGATTAQIYAWLEIKPGTVLTNHTFYPMIRLATETDASFEPYSNICPITGITTATVQTTDGETTNTASMELGETVFGGSVNFNNGTGSKTKASVDLGSLTWTYESGGTRFTTDSLADLMDVSISSLTPLLCEVLTQDTSPVSGGDVDNSICAYRTGGLFVRCTKYTDAAAFTEAMTGYKLIYPLATPTALTLTPSALTMLNGEQTVSGNGETVTISYDGNVKQYIDTKVPDAPTTDGTYTLTCVVSGGVPTYSWT